MNNSNITNIYKKKEKKDMIIKWKYNILNLKIFYNQDIYNESTRNF